MLQVTICRKDDAMASAKSLAVADGRVKAQTDQVDAHGYPPGFFECIAANARHWQDFFQAEALRASPRPDLARETW